jgi:hypothetical protein
MSAIGEIAVSYFGTIGKLETSLVTSNLVLRRHFCLISPMFRSRLTRILTVGIGSFVFTHTFAVAVSKAHVVTFGKWATVQLVVDSSDGSEGDALVTSPITLKVRPLLVDSHVKEFTLGAIHEITERQFVVRRAFRINDSLPQESNSPPHWQWQRGGWLLVDRVTGHVSPIKFLNFDLLESSASWYRDYAAYCGFSDDSKQLYAVVAQINRRKPLLKKLLEGPRPRTTGTKDAGNSACPLPTWQRNPARVSFEPLGGVKQTFAIRGHSVDLLSEEDDDEAEK